MDERLLTEKLIGFDSSDAHGVKLAPASYGLARGARRRGARAGCPRAAGDGGGRGAADAPITVLLHGHLDVVPGHEEQFEPRASRATGCSGAAPTT